MYLIIETADREMISVHAAQDKPAAVVKANELLAAHCRLGGHIEDYESASSGRVPDNWPEDLKLAGDGDHQDGTGAWCNLKCGAVQHWDAHIFYVPEELRGAILDTALKTFCKTIMAAQNSKCGDGSCDTCPINELLEMLEQGDDMPDGSDADDGDGFLSEEEGDELLRNSGVPFDEHGFPLGISGHDN